MSWNFFKDRGYTFRNNRKAELLEFCSIASSLNIEIDPNGLIEDRDYVLNTNKKTHSNPQFHKGFNDISFCPLLLILNTYNFLLTAYDHASLRD